MDGVPIFNLVRETLPARARPRLPRHREQHDELHPHRHGTGAAVRGRAGRDAGARASRRPTRRWMSTAGTRRRRRRRSPTCCWTRTSRRRDVDRQGIGPDTGTRARGAGRGPAAEARGARGARGAGASRRASHRRNSPATTCWRGVDGQQNALILKTDLLDEIAIVQRGGGLTQTAYALLSDLVPIARDVTGASATRRSPSRARRRRTL